MPYPDFTEKSGIFICLRDRLLDAISLTVDSHFIVALSGGADSIMLAYFFIWLRKRERISLSFAHFRHNLRPAEDDHESKSLIRFAKEWKVPYVEESAQVLDIADDRGDGIEEAARFARHSFLEEQRQMYLAEGVEQVFLALGHNLDDLVETVLINLGRGTGMRGLASMPYFDGRIIRPILVLEANEIRSFLDSRGLTYFEDSSNYERTYLRNRLRLDIIPAWKEALGFFPGPQIFAMSENIRKESEALEEIVVRALEEIIISSRTLNLKQLKLWPSGLHYRIINRWLQEVLGKKFTLSSRIYSDLEKKLNALPTRGSFSLHKGIRLEVNSWKLELIIK